MSRQLPHGWRLTALDLALIAWAVVWIVLGVRVADEVKGLRELSGTVSTVGRAVEESSRTLRGVELPILGQGVEELFGGEGAEVLRRAQEAGASARDSGRSSRESISNLSTLLGLSVAVIPTSPLLFLYLPLRLGRRREAQALRRTLREVGDGPDVERFLARRAIQNLSYRRLREVSPHPWRDAEEGRCSELADAELARLGLDRRS